MLVVAYEIARSLGYRWLPNIRRWGSLLAEETLKQAERRFYDTRETLKLIEKLRRGCVRVVERRVVDVSGVHPLTLAFYGDVLGKMLG
ncbi:hypothetical protein TCELL_0630 [Thermogladius calderae 1633]|uniref:Uncharacterized protein n=1 Tax=Thermogladius calderae (strain DSM 22663 / VKM B-2946 / 1633) TaxID=1184251 RepID=I3TE66_THEC1|nr:hypothetical protein [Thermogladius calderae]AFK51054.1 hypothetical protein TCELL_0630 [Thermogladius calderae 1633]